MKRKRDLFSRELINDRPESYLQALQDTVPGNTDLVLCVLSNSRKDRYDALKKYLCLDNPVPSQVKNIFCLLINRFVKFQMVLTKTLTRRNQLMSIATKIGIQINAKLGGEIWGVHIPTKTLMVIGMDSYHGNEYALFLLFVKYSIELDSKRRGASVGAFVASTNPTLTRFYSRVIYQRTAQELMDGLAVCMKGIEKKLMIELIEICLIYRCITRISSK
jgi:aubergine-like protein